MRCLLAALIVLAACGDDAVDVPPEANPLGSTSDVLPFPSSLYERTDGTLDIPVGAFPENTVTGAAFDPTPINTRRGWPATSTMLWAAPGGVDPTALVGPDSIATSIDPTTSATVVVDMTTGELVPHFAEVDANEVDNFSRQAVYIRPAQRLAGEHRYAVGIRKSLKSRDGKALPVSAGFQAVLDNKDTGHARLDAARPRLRQAVDAVVAAGVKRTDLLVAWDFTIAPDMDAIVDPLAARDAALSAMGPLAANMTYTVKSDLGTPNGDPRLARRIEIEFQAPLVVGPEITGFLRDDSGKVIAQGTMTAKGYINVPPCATFDSKAPTVLYGHGFFGTNKELKDAEYAREIGKDCYIVAGTEWVGMSNDDIPNALLALNDLNKGWGFGQKIWQGIVNMMTLAQLLRGKLATELLVDSQSRSIVAVDRQHLLGISLGHVLGSTLFAYDPFIQRAVLHVGAANWALMFERSSNWQTYGVPLKASYVDLLEAVIMEQVLQMALEGVDGSTVVGVTIPNTPPKQILMQTSLDDTQVPNLASFYQARSLGVTLLDQSVTVPYGFESRKATSASNAWLIIDENPNPKPPSTNEVFGYTNDAHEHARRYARVHQQMREFWTTGTATNPCTGTTCNCAAGNCGDLILKMYGGS
jgi:hypothetical protein